MEAWCGRCFAHDCICGRWQNSRRIFVRQHRVSEGGAFLADSRFDSDRLLLFVGCPVAARTVRYQPDDAGDVMAFVPEHAGFAGTLVRARRCGALARNDCGETHTADGTFAWDSRDGEFSLRFVGNIVFWKTNKRSTIINIGGDFR